MFPKKIILNKYKDKRGLLLELLPRNFKKKFIYSILTHSKKNVIRGLHYDKEMKEEKFIFLIEGNILDVCVNLKKGKNFKKKYYNSLKKNEALYIPRGYAHGYKCKGQKNVLIYLLTKSYNAKKNKGIFWNDSSLNIKWRIKNPIVSKTDLNLPKLK